MVAKIAWAKKNRHKTRAEQIANRALRRGRIQPKLACELCGVSKPTLHKHHVDYSLPLSVTFLCSTCHGLVHQKDYIGKFKPNQETQYA